MASSRKRSRQQLPSIESLLQDDQQVGESFANLKSGLEVISHTRLINFGREKLQSLGEAQKISRVFGNYAEIRNVCFATFCVDAETMPGCPSKGLRRHITTPSTYLEI